METDVKMCWKGERVECRGRRLRRGVTERGDEGWSYAGVRCVGWLVTRVNECGVLRLYSTTERDGAAWSDDERDAVEWVGV